MKHITKMLSALLAVLALFGANTTVRAELPADAAALVTAGTTYIADIATTSANTYTALFAIVIVGAIFAMIARALKRRA